jgi:hypothetical protein
VTDRRQLHARSRVMAAVKTDIAISHVLLFALASATACDLDWGKGDSGPLGDDDGGFDDGSAESSDDAGSSNTTYEPGETSADGSITATSPSGPGECDASHSTGGESGVLDGDDDGGASGSTSSASGWVTETTDPTVGDTEGGPTCDLPLAPGGFFYGCECEDGSCDISYDNVAQIPGFETLCNCLCEAKGCGAAVGGVGEAGGEDGGEDGGESDVDGG